nr:glycerate kinase [Pseudomonas aeruginosa]
AGDEIEEGGLALKALRQIDLNRLDERLHKVRIEVACDVNNPLTGLHGASHVFGPQKGATPDQVLALDEALNTYADIVAALLQKDVRDFPGAGAAGGIGFAAKAFLHAEFRPGVQLIADLSGLSQAVQGAVSFSEDGCTERQKPTAL